MEGVEVPSRQLVVVHGTRSGQDDALVPLTQWRDSAHVFTPSAIKGSRGGAYYTTARAKCSICGAIFIYKDPVPRNQTTGFVIGAVVSVLAFLICLHISYLLSMLVLLLEAVFLLLAVKAIAKPPEPFFQQLSGPTQFRHQVKQIG
jgi:hypothetical protein